MRHLWQQACGALAPMVAAPRGAELWYLANDIPFLQEDAKDAADIESVKATSLRTLVDGGFDPVSAIEAVDAQDITLLEHTGKLSVQLQEPGTTLAGSGTAGNPVEDDDDSTS
jgi:hypothetical protein